MSEKNNVSEQTSLENAESGKESVKPSSGGPNIDRLMISIIVCITLFVVMYFVVKCLGL